MAVHKTSSTTDPNCSNNNARIHPSINNKDDDDEVLIMNFDEEWGEDGQIILPQPICEHVKPEPRLEEFDVESLDVSQESDTAIDRLHTSQDLDELNVKMEYLSQNQNSQTQSQSKSTDKTKLPIKVTIAASDINGELNINSGNYEAQDEASPPRASVIGANKTLTEPSILMDDDDDEFHETNNVSNNFSITYQKFYTCQQCQFKTVQESDLQKHLAECHVNVVPDISAMLALHLNDSVNSTENESGATNDENIDLVDSPSEEKAIKSISIPNSKLKYQFSNSRASKPNWSLRETYSSDEEGNINDSSNKVNTKSKKRFPSSKVKVPKDLKCTECPVIAKNEFQWKIHTFEHTKGTQSIKCTDCNFEGTSYTVWQHMIDCHKRINLSCKTDLIQKSTKKAKVQVKRKRKCRCPYCSMVTTHISYFRRHLKRHEVDNEKVLQCPVCSARYFERALTMHVRKENFVEGKYYSCPKCPMTTTCKTTFQTHLFNNKGMDVCSPVNRFKAIESNINQLVPSAFPSPPVLSSSSHRKIIERNCNTCADDNNTDKISKKLDVRWKCTECPHIAGSKALLVQHLDHHRKGLKMVKCVLCVYWGPQESVRRHQWLAHRGKVHSMGIKMKGFKSLMCHKCDYKTTNMNCLQIHIEKNKNLTKCISIKKGRPKKPQKVKVRYIPQNSHIIVANQGINTEDNVTKKQNSTEIVTIDVDDIEVTNEIDNNAHQASVKKYKGVTITPVAVPNATKRVSVIQDLRFFRRPSTGSVDRSQVPLNNSVPNHDTSNVIAQKALATTVSSISEKTTTSCGLKPGEPQTQAQTAVPTPPLNASVRNAPPTYQTALAYKCKLCSFITNSEIAVKDHVNHHQLLKHHTTAANPLYSCQKCKYKTKIVDNFAVHLNANKDKSVCDVVERATNQDEFYVAPEDIIEIQSDDESQGPKGEKIPCTFCEFKAASSGGLQVHMRFRHPKDLIKKSVPSNTQNTPIKEPANSIPLQESSGSPSARSKSAKKKGPNLPPLIPFSNNASPNISVEVKPKKNDVNKLQEGMPVVSKEIPDPPASKTEKQHDATPSIILEKNCSHCSFKSIDSLELKKHEKTHDFSCHECGFVTDSESIFNSHVDAHIENHQKAILSLKTINNPGESSSKESCQTPLTISKSYACQDCDYVSGIQANFFAHRELHIKANEAAKVRNLVQYNIQPAAGQNVSIAVFQCKECTYETNRMSELQVHQQTHQTPPAMPKNLFSCTHCNFRAIYKNVLDRHVETSHTDNKNNSYTQEAHLSNPEEPSSDSSDSDYEPLMSIVTHKKRKLSEKSRNSPDKRRKSIKNCDQQPTVSGNSTSNTAKNDGSSDELSDLEKLLDQKEVYTKEFKKEIMDQDLETSDLENLLGYVDINPQPPETGNSDEHNFDHIIEILSDSDEQQGGNNQDTSLIKKRKTKTCRTCNKFTSPSIQGIRFHALEVHEGRIPNKCSCGYKSFSIVLMKRHKRNDCELERDKKSQRKGLNKGSTQNKMSSLKCSNCNFKTVNKRRFVKHKKSGCDGTTSQVSKPTNKRKTFKCPLCFYKSGIKARVEKHFSMCHVDDE